MGVRARKSKRNVRKKHRRHQEKRRERVSRGVGGGGGGGVQREGLKEKGFLRKNGERKIHVKSKREQREKGATHSKPDLTPSEEMRWRIKGECSNNRKNLPREQEKKIVPSKKGTAGRKISALRRRPLNIRMEGNLSSANKGLRQEAGTIKNLKENSKKRGKHIARPF